MLDALKPLQGHVDTFFSEVFVNVEDPALQANRKVLVKCVARLPQSVIDISKLKGYVS